LTHHTTPRRRAAVASLGLVALSLVGVPAQASAAVLAGDAAGGLCAEDSHEGEAAGSAARGGYGPDTRAVSASEQRAIARRTDAILDRQRGKPSTGTASVSIPVYVHVMAAKDGTGNVTDAQIADQVAVLNTTFAGAESSDAAQTGYTFTLAGTDRFFNDTWHRDGSSSKYRKATRQGGANALNMWLVDFNYLGIATFPWDYAKQPGIDGVRVHWDSLPGGSIANYNLGETGTHEVGHWLGLYHTFQGGCTQVNDEVADTPAQSSPTNGCPVGRDSCDLPGLDPINNYMDYSYDSCYTEFSPGQSTRMDDMWAAYRA
jgi:hypothetical protein